MENKLRSKSVAKNIHGKEYQCNPSHSSLCLCSKNLKNTSIDLAKLLKYSSKSEKSGLVKQREKLPYRRNVELKKPAESSSNSEQSGSKKRREKFPYRRNTELKKPEAVQVSDSSMHEGDAKNKRDVDAEAKPTNMSDFDLNVFPPN
ncbi:hypothetical protein MRB53_006989 [Persea americana]|uniref:Uncharacterized protein n=1 Tax=Persea americana TaxID=3435 RepID=A0ACC2MHZ1_PERAE|nr:hypothetical protein MRB53_006989 [Persea americana]|eukprot:TRINITY_DN10546_c0_g2_i1.p1 TRINITY_DN10546_c0_g2~~TRINITY_DN10546_c0_g2_i1.p1  ORF type:complete len:147 (+),score=37.10 TRINITY_DN10546_c0_g2_i1:915-1355(+)